MLVMYTLLHHYYTLLQLSFCLLAHVNTKPIITLLLHIFTLLVLVITSIIIACFYKFIITYIYIIIASLSRHYYLILQSSKFMIMDSLVQIIALACFIITSLLPIMSLFPLITYY